jgi:choline dehydrogenase-like flavoprotein
MTANDRYRLNHAAIVCRKILVKMGCDPDSIFVSPQRGTHPSCTVRIGEIVDTNLQTEVKNLYVCDASTFPEALDRPTVLTIIGLGKRLSDHLLTTVFRREVATHREPAAPEPVAVSSEPLSVLEPPTPSSAC